MTELFNIPETLSPRLAWIKKHDVTLNHAEHLKAEEDPWAAYVGDLILAMDMDEIGTGRTEELALANLAIIKGWLLWNEEGATKCL